MLLALILLVSVVGVFSVNNSVLDLLVMVVMGVVGYGLRRAGLSPATLILPFVIGTLMEQSLVQTLMLARGRPGYLLERPIALALLLAGAAALAWPWLANISYSRERSAP
ncbi:MAG: tripartite tricarboxylate transporter permease [Candidatus Rokubacteria bacterium]|nr:tripartite tricarboxylate transporter permease [Candidatus Rokubacteria bacterium]